ncbi:sec-independent translocase [Nocardioides sambongensis]|uniref:sec-independent translocase n=1 Tax=Nocardioides sambongensis TaxID=2589074 RepID=UPI00112CE916|nr:sec-independent translocase [Nocardioides sambongensis]
MFGIGFAELVVIAFVAVVVFGPDKIPGIARQVAQVVKQIRRFANNARDELRTELGPEYSDLELRDLDPRQIVRKHITEALAEEEAEERRQAKEKRSALPAGERPPFDLEAT